MKKHVLVALVMCVTVSAIVFGIAGTSQEVRPQKQVAGARGGESLREAAKRNGSAIASAHPNNLRLYEDVASLAGDSSAVVVGSVKSGSSSLLQPAGRMVVTDYTVGVGEVLKGGLQPGSDVTVRTPGGRVVFEDGTTAEVQMPDYWKTPQQGKTYLLFLQKRGPQNFVLLGGPQGMFEVTPEGSVVPQVRASDKLMQNYNGKDFAAVRQEIPATAAGRN